jgi:hypothetical protein
LPLTFDIHNAKGLVYLPACQPTADGHDDLAAALILLYVKLDHALLRGNLLECADVDLSQQLNVHRPAL